MTCAILILVCMLIYGFVALVSSTISFDYYFALCAIGVGVICDIIYKFLE